MAAEHGELLGEMATVGRLSATERLKHAQKRRAQQLKGWAQMEKDSTRGSRAKADRKKARTRRVKFPDTITLLEAASRNDVEEGGWSGRHTHKKNKRTDGDTHTHAYIHTQTDSDIQTHTS